VSVLFADRAAAGRALARALAGRTWAQPLVVLALPRGGVPVAAEVARALHAPLDLLLVRKIGAPGQPELAVAAVVDGTPPDVVVDEETATLSGADTAYIEQQAQRELQEIERRRHVYLQDREPLPVRGGTAVVVDDGMATGTTARAALRALKRRGPGRTLLAVPLAAHSAVAPLAAEVDEIVCLAQPWPFHAVGPHDGNFRQVDDAEVLAALARTRGDAGATATAPP